MMEKKEYLPPKMEVVEMPFGGILCQSPGPEVIPAVEEVCTVNCGDDDWGN